MVDFRAFSSSSPGAGEQRLGSWGNGADLGWRKQEFSLGLLKLSCLLGVQQSCQVRRLRKQV